MKTTKFFLASFCFILSSLFNANAQWSGNAPITTTSSVGIGTTSPSNKLHVVEASQSEFYGSGLQYPAGTNIVLEGTETGRTVGKGPSLLFKMPANTNGANPWDQARILASPDNSSNGDARGRLYLQVRDFYDFSGGIYPAWNWRTGIMIAANGNVGIGSTSPLAKLYVNSGSNNYYASVLATSELPSFFTNKLVVSSTNNSGENQEIFRISHEFNDIPTRNNGYIGFSRGTDTGHGFLTLGANGEEKVKILESGIDVKGSVGYLISTDKFGYSKCNKDIGNYSLGWYEDTQKTGSLTMYASGYAGMKFFTQHSPRLTINFAGFVGIGTDNPQKLLDVNGTIHAKEVLVDNIGWADFVFEKKYKLPSLNEVSQYIQTNGHLPNIPSETEVKENGVNVAEMQAKLLQKIEELTLYVIEQDNKIAELQKEVDKR